MDQNNWAALSGDDRISFEKHRMACQIFTIAVGDMRIARDLAIKKDTAGTWKTFADRYDDIFDLLTRWPPENVTIN